MKSPHFFATTLLILATMATPAALAQDVDNTGNITVGVFGYIFDSDRNQDDDMGFMIGGEMPLTERWSLDTGFYSLKSEVDKGSNAKSDLDFYRAGINYHLDKIGAWQPYVSAGLGQLEIEQDIFPVNDANDSVFDLGVGVKRRLSGNMMLRGDYKMVFSNHPSANDSIVTLGLSYAFGSRQSRPVAASPAPARTAAPAPAAPEGDSDGDGVLDSRDRCPDTPRNLAVDANGCPILDRSQRRQELQVNFDFDKSDVKPQYDAEIADFAEFMATYGNTNVVIEGHTDSVGTDAYNQGLSERRANAVRNELVNEHNVAADRVSAVGYGESRPVDTNDTAAGRANNRRIEAVISVEIEEQRRR